MATGKQLTFQSGEVSPSMRFNSAEVSYATGLARLKNGYVRKDGGVSNRPGFRARANTLTGTSDESDNNFLNLSSEASGVPSKRGKPKFSLYNFWDHTRKKWRTLEILLDTPLDAISNSTEDILYWKLDGTARGAVKIFASEINHIRPIQDLTSINVQMVGDALVFYPYMNVQIWGYIGSGKYTLLSYNAATLSFNLTSESFGLFGRPNSEFVTMESGGVVKSKGSVPVFPGAYLLTFVSPSGFEGFIHDQTPVIADITAIDPADDNTPSPWYSGPNIGTAWKVKLFCSAPKADEYSVRLYKAPWAEGESWAKNFSFVASGKMKPTSVANEYTLNLLDFGVTDPTEKPHIVRYMINEGVFTGEYLSQAKFITYFQQRVHAFCEKTNLPTVTYDTNTSGGTDTMNVREASRATDKIIVSKQGANTLFNQPIMYMKESDAFEYSIFEARGETPLAAIEAERLIIFTSRSVWAMMGDQKGSVTPFTQNAVKIGSVGIAPSVQPKIAGKRAFFLSNDNRRLFRIDWDNVSLSFKIHEESAFSSHLLEGESVVKIETTSNREDSIFLLTSRGKVIYATILDNMRSGWSTFELGESAYFENIASVRVIRSFEEDFEDFLEGENVYRDSLSAYVVRNGLRSLVVLEERRDEGAWESQVFLDYASFVGTTLTEYKGSHWAATLPMQRSISTTNPVLNFRRVSFDTVEVFPMVKAQPRVNIGDDTITNWEAGTLIPIYTSENLTPKGNVAGIDFSSDYRIEFPYEVEWEDSNRISRKSEMVLRLNIVGPSSSSAKYPYLPRKYFAEIELNDVPEELRSVADKDISSEEKTKIQTRWDFSYKTFAQEIQYPEHLSDSNGSLIYLYLLGKAESNQVKVNVVYKNRILSSIANPQYQEEVFLKREPYSSGGVNKERIRVDFDDYVSGFWAGFPYEFEMQTLPIDASDNRTLRTGATIVNDVGFGLLNTAGGFVGMPNTELAKMEPMDLVKNQTPYFLAQTPINFTGYVSFTIPSEWNDGTISIKHVDPTPISVVALYPRGESSARG